MENLKSILVFQFFTCFFISMLFVSCKNKDKSKDAVVETYTIIFDEIKMSYHSLTVPRDVRNYRICFDAKSGNNTKNIPIEKKLGYFLPEYDVPTPIPLKGLKLENVQVSDGCTVHIGFDGSSSKACTEDAEISFPLKIGESEFNYFNNSHGAYMPLYSDRSNFRLDVIYRIEKSK